MKKSKFRKKVAYCADLCLYHQVTWLFNQHVIPLDDHEILIKDTNDVCQLIIPRISDHHYGIYTIVAENEVGKAKCAGYLSRIPYQSLISTVMNYY
uniref:Immunoglobulin I-set domain-containing protein n=1 Tax=Romanomermis culicivorax TaxID=13658 RepID=A0A915HJE7_ROMCU